tara:strand:- start:196 stop:837 length:642 start_codon:yes stop_codon:yes gene_type:complete
MSVTDLINRRDVGTFASMRLRAQDKLCLAEPISLAKGRVHEVTGGSADMFAVLAASRLRGPIIWIGRPREINSLSPSGLQGFIDPARMILIECISRREVLWAAEQSLGASCAQCVIIELSSGPNLRESRRLQIASEEGGGIGLILVSGRVQTSACETRWHCEPSKTGRNIWDWSLTKNRKGELGTWRVQWSNPLKRGGAYETGVIHLAAATAA